MRQQKLAQLLSKYESKDLKGDFLTFELFFYDVLSSRSPHQLYKGRRSFDQRGQPDWLVQGRFLEDQRRIPVARAVPPHRVL